MTIMVFIIALRYVHIIIVIVKPGARWPLAGARLVS